MGLRICALAILVLFSLYTGWTMLIAEQSLLAFGLALLAQPDTAQVVIDLYLMAGLAGCWMVRDNRMRGNAGIAVLPYLLLTVVFVSLGPLLYLVIRGVAEGRQP
ncbi:TPA: DUF2834 domain-containing protein [Pseudomonas putida]|uniref:DUF2834 domain-containing protein n=1 Tax=Pseudomonas TaxID=286 RepID=UPI000B3CFAE2|nr:MULTISPECIES: DUF2834 domain-containing protein [Pseudomonas]MDF3930659.1 DUF2834 domain-containing protein [Pseudomonas putida]MDN5519609.1 DUF2834 domain-containing protein [Pseudomonas sp.]MDN5531335.1 DUF2834 domain-containing protein [Pseudomonas sp.]OUS82182.1 DUF2834 domain-containing protein [Pseudomonas putida]OUS88132.1 DUF2834 domain-containing protein [Pseudomonas putida]